MAQATTLKFGKQSIVIGDGASPEVFSAPCGFTQLTRTLNVNTQDVNIPDCNDPDLASWLATDEESRQMIVSGQGVLAEEAMVLWDDWFLNGGEKNVRWNRTATAPLNGYFAGPGVLTAYEESAQRGQRWNVSVTIAFNGAPVWNAV
jgi:hypothetical protein